VVSEEKPKVVSLREAWECEI